MSTPLSRRTPQQNEWRRLLAGGAQRVLPATELVEVYTTFVCRVGQHPDCTEGTAREPDPEVPQVTYQACGCECHDPVGAR